MILTHEVDLLRSSQQTELMTATTLSSFLEYCQFLIDTHTLTSKLHSFLTNMISLSVLDLFLLVYFVNPSMLIGNS